MPSGIYKRTKQNYKYINLKGKRYGRLLVLFDAGRDNRGGVLWNCLCDCDNEKIIRAVCLRNGDTKSCGCLRKERGKEYIKTLHNMGENNSNWNPNLTDEDRQHTRRYPEYLEWRSSVYERDNFTCQICGDDKGGNLVAHHLESYHDNKELRTELDNGLTLCKKCHDNFHHQYGYGDNTREQFEEFIGGK